MSSTTQLHSGNAVLRAESVNTSRQGRSYADFATFCVAGGGFRLLNRVTQLPRYSESKSAYRRTSVFVEVAPRVSQ